MTQKQYDALVSTISAMMDVHVRLNAAVAVASAFYGSKVGSEVFNVAKFYDECGVG